MSCWLTTVRRLDESYRPRVFFLIQISCGFLLATLLFAIFFWLLLQSPGMQFRQVHLPVLLESQGLSSDLEVRTLF